MHALHLPAHSAGKMLVLLNVQNPTSLFCTGVIIIKLMVWWGQSAKLLNVLRGANSIT